MSVPPLSLKKDTGRRNNPPPSAPAASSSFVATRTRPINEPRNATGSSQAINVADHPSSGERGGSSWYSSLPESQNHRSAAHTSHRSLKSEEHRTSVQSTTTQDTGGSVWSWMNKTTTMAAGRPSSSVKSSNTIAANSTVRSDADSGYAESVYTNQDSLCSNTSDSSAESHSHEPQRRDSHRRRGSSLSSASDFSNHTGPNAPLRSPPLDERGRKQTRSSSQASYTDGSAARSTITRSSHRRSNSDTISSHAAQTYGTLDASLQHRRSSDSKATRPKVSNTSQGLPEQRVSRTTTASSASVYSMSSFAGSTSRDQPSGSATSNTLLTRLNTDVSTRKTSQPQPEQTSSRLSKPLPDIPESPATPVYPKSAGVGDQPSAHVFKHHTSPPTIIWLPEKSSKGLNKSLHRRALNNSQRSKSASRSQTTVISSDSLGRGSSSSLAAPGNSSGDLFAIEEIAHALEDVSDVFQKRDVVSVKDAVEKFLTAVDGSTTSLLDGLPEAVQNAHTVAVAVSAVNARKTVFADHCTTIKPGAATTELDHVFRFAVLLMRDLCTDFAKLLGECSAALRKHRAAPEDYVDLNTFDGALQTMDKATQATLASALRIARESRNLGKHDSTLVSILKTVLPRPLKKNTVPPQATSSRFSGAESPTVATCFPLTRKRSKSDPTYGQLDKSSDGMIQGLNLELKSAKLAFDCISRNYLSAPNDKPRSLNPLQVRYSEPKDGTKPRMVAITVYELVRFFTHNTDSPEPDTITLMDAFFLFFRSYVGAAELADIMIKIYSEPVPAAIENRPEERRKWRASQASTKLGVVRLVALWLDQYFVLGFDSPALEKLNHFTFEVVAKDRDLPGTAAWLISIHICDCMGDRREHKFPHYPSAFEKLLEDGEQGRPTYKKTGFSHDVVDKLSEDEMLLQEIMFFAKMKGGTDEVARALTLEESIIIHKSIPTQFFHHREEKPHPTIVEMAGWSNALTLWIRESIQTPKDARERAAAFNAFAAVMLRCFELRNYSSAHSILVALKSIISNERYIVTMQRVDLFAKEAVQKVDTYFGDPRKNYPVYRKHMATVSAPANPLFFVVGGDLAKVAAMKKQVEAKHGLKHLSKRQSWLFPQYLTKLQGIVRDLERCYALYKIPVNARIQWWIKEKVNGLEDCNYEDHVRKLAAIYHADEAAYVPPYLERKPTFKSNTTT